MAITVPGLATAQNVLGKLQRRKEPENHDAAAELERRVEEAKERLGFTLWTRPEAKGATVWPLKEGGEPQMVAVHKRPPRLAKVLESEAPTFAVLSRAVPADDSAFRQALEKARRDLPWEPDYLTLLNAAEEHFCGNQAFAFAREAIITGPEEEVLGKALGAPNAVGQETPLRANELARLMYAVATHSLPPNGGGLGVHPLLQADADVRFNGGHYVVGGDGAAQCAIWKIVPHNLEDLQKLNIDLHFHFENLGGRELWVRSATARGSGTAAELQRLESGLRSCCSRVERVPGWHPLGHDLKTFHYATLPGSPYPPPASMVFSVPEWGRFLKDIVSQTDATGVACGDMAIGKSIQGNEPTIFFNWEDRRIVVVEGPTGSGKTILAMLLAFLQTHRVFIIHMTPCENEAAGRFARKIHGQYRNIPFPTPKTPEEFSAEVTKLEAEIDLLVDGWEKQWLTTGRTDGLPFVLRPASGSRALYAYYVTYFLRKLRPLVENFCKATGGKRFVFVMDDLFGIPGRTPDEHLGEITVNKGDELREEIQFLMNLVRKIGGSMILAEHHRKAFRLFGDNFWESTPLCLSLPSDVQHSAGVVWYPPDTDLDAKVDTAKLLEGEEVEIPAGFRSIFNPWLPPPILNILLAED